VEADDGVLREAPEVTRRISAADLAAMLEDGGELALLDVREEGVFAKGHLFLAASVPLSRLELKLARLVPRRSTRIVLCDADDGLAERAAAKLGQFGYTSVAALAAGVDAWRALGRELFAGVYVPSKAFGEHVEHRDGTPSISAEELAAKRAAGEKMVVLDSRPLAEFQRMSLPGALDCPGAELVHRIFEVAPDPDTLVVVNCAGRTRSIIGAQSLRNAGVPHRVVALRNGTMGWTLAGLELEHGKREMAPPPGAAALEKARAAAQAVAARFGVRDATDRKVREWRRDGERTLYLFDVRTPEEYLAGHLPEAASAPGGQLVQSTDAYVGTRNARIVLVDADGVRAPMTASWLAQMGWRDVFVWADAMVGATLVEGPAPAQVLGLGDVRATSPGELKRLLDAGKVEVVDLASSLEYRRGHIPGAAYAIRSRLARSLPKLAAGRPLVFTSPDGVLARLAAPEAASWNGPVSALDGGTAAWSAAGLALDPGATRMLDDTDDVYYLPYDHGDSVEQAMRDYLTWEVALVGQLARENVRFPEFPQPPG
jgi:rhodanese-related sulfurtransferase